MSSPQSITMKELPERLGSSERPVVLDVRSRAEFLAGHVPGALNVPMREIRRSPRGVAQALPPRDVVFVHCTKGMRATRAIERLRRAGVDDAVLVEDSGFADWKKSGLPIERGLGRPLRARDSRPFGRVVATGIAAGFLATLASGIANTGLSLLVDERQKRRERRVRRGSPHEVGGALLLERMLGRKPSTVAKLFATLGFNVVYSAMWGLVYAGTRRAFPRSATAPALPFTAAAFFVACDGGIAPALGLTPNLPRLPWQFNAKELVNHVVWNATAEMIHRADERAYARRNDG